MNVELKSIQTLINHVGEEQPTGDPWLDIRYDEQKEIVGHTQPYYRLFYRIAEILKPSVVVELGGWQGTAAAHFAAGAPEATVITIDHHRDPGDEFNRMKILDVVHRYPNVKYLQGWTTPGYEEEWHKGAVSVFEDVKNLLDNKGIDILFIDSWHEGRYFKRDWDYYQPLLADPALVICDDVFDSEIFIDMVATWESLPGEKFLDTKCHSGIQMGFLKYGTPAKTRTTRKKRTTAKRTT